MNNITNGHFDLSNVKNASLHWVLEEMNIMTIALMLEYDIVCVNSKPICCHDILIFIHVYLTL